MNLGPTILIVLFMVFNFAFANLDFQQNNNMKQSLFESTRAANQNSLYELQEKYDSYDEITTNEMLEKWLINFCNNNSLTFEDIVVEFKHVKTEPIPLYVCRVKGYKDSYFIFKSNEAMASYINGAMLIEKEINEEEGD